MKEATKTLAEPSNWEMNKLMQCSQNPTSTPLQHMRVYRH